MTLRDDIDDGETGTLDWVHPHVTVDDDDELSLVFMFPKNAVAGRSRCLEVTVPFSALRCITCDATDGYATTDDKTFEEAYRWLVAASPAAQEATP